MDIGKSLHDSSEYAKDVVWGKWVRWILLIFCTLFFPLFLGYEVEIYRGNKPAPDWCKLERFFIEGLKLLIIQLIYAIPVLIILFLTIGAAVLAITSPAGAMAMWGSFAIGIILTIIVAIIIGLVQAMGVVRFARTGKMGEAFNFGAIFETIGKIGWFSNIFAMIVMFLVDGIIVFILSFIPFLVVLLLILILAIPVLVVFSAQYVTLVYESVPTEALPASPPAT